MLIGLDPRLTPDLLFHLARLGHGDEIAVVDRNFPAYSKPGNWAPSMTSAPARRGRGEVPVVELCALEAPATVAMILQLVPLDTFVPNAAFRMEVVGDPERTEPVQAEAAAALSRHDARPFEGLERFAFYDRAGRAQLIVRSGETRFYGCFLFTVGAVSPDDAARCRTS